MAKERKAQGLADALVEFAPLLRQGDEKLQEEADFKEATGQEDNASFIETYGKGYIAQYVMKSRVAEYIKEIAVVK